MTGLLTRKAIKQSLRRAGFRFAALAICVQFLVPTGYMPGSLADGTPFVLCNMFNGLPSEHGDSHSAAAHDMHSMQSSMSQAASATSAEHANHIGEEAWEHCPLGALGAGAALAFDFDPQIPQFETDQISTFPGVPRTGTSTLTQRARAPPYQALNLIA